MLARVGLYWHVFPTYKQGRKIMWNGMTKEGRRFTDYFPPLLIRRKLEDEMMIELKNDSIYQVVGTDQIDSLVGANPVGVVMSEYALQDPAAWDLLRPILAENGGWAIFPYTPRGRNHGYELWLRGQRLMEKYPGKWFVEKLTVDDTQAIDYSVIEEDRESGMAGEMIQQEYWCSFDAPLVGSYFGPQMNDVRASGRLTRLPWVPNVPVDTWWDIGVSDSTSVWFVQEIGEWIHVIDYFEDSGKGAEWYAKKLAEKPYAYGRHFGPHDVSKQEFGSGKTIVETCSDLGIRFRVVPRVKNVNDRINAARATLPRCRFDEARCDRGIRALTEYCKEWNDEKRCFEDKPFHNWASHAADAFGTGCMGRREMKPAPRQIVAQSDWDPLARPPRQAVAEDWDPLS